MFPEAESIKNIPSEILKFWIEKVWWLITIPLQKSVPVRANQFLKNKLHPIHKFKPNQYEKIFSYFNKYENLFHTVFILFDLCLLDIQSLKRRMLEKKH